MNPKITISHNVDEKKTKIIESTEIVEEFTEIVEITGPKFSNNEVNDKDADLVLAKSGIYSDEGNKVRKSKIITGVFGNEKIAVAKDRRRIYIGG